MDKKKKQKQDSADNLKQQVEEYKNRFLRALADYQNLEKRLTTEKEEIRNSAEEKLIRDLLPVVDGLQKAKDHFKDEGIHLINKQLHAALARAGFTRIPAPKPEELFDPKRMECIQVVEGEKDNEVVEEVLPGYKLRDKMLRPMQVKVSKKNKS